MWFPSLGRAGAHLAAAALLLAGFFLRVYRLEEVPPGWRDDEVIESTVHAQRVLDGELPLFFPEASGHEPLYHWLSAAGFGAWGQGLFQARLVSAFFGLLALAAHFRLARRLFGLRAALIATVLLAFSFWALMYSRVKVRHISALVFALLAFDGVIQGLGVALGRRLRRNQGQVGQGLPLVAAWGGTRGRWVMGYASRITDYALRFTFHVLRPAPLFLALSLHTYFAARAAPLVLLGLGAYLALFHRPLFARAWRPLALALGGAALLVVPMGLAIAAVPGAQARLDEVGGPLAALLAGDPRPALAGTLTTLGMFAFTGDPEALYNLPGRPVLPLWGAALFAVGLAVCAWRWRDLRHAFTLIWLLVGLAPAFVSIPAASLGHTILALPAACLVLAIGLDAGIAWADRRLRVWNRHSPALRRLGLAACVLCLAALAFRDLRDYFVVWPAEAQVRHLYRAEIRAAALRLRDIPVADVALTGRLSLWDARALELDAPHLRARWFNPETALVYPANPQASLVVFSDPPAGEWAQALIAGGYQAAPVPDDFALWLPVENRDPAAGTPAGHAWTLGLRLASFTILDAAQPGQALEVVIAWEVAEGYVPPPPGIGHSLDPPPQPFTTFVHVLGPNGAFVTGYDRFDANGFRLWPGDVVLQRYLPTLPDGLAPGEYTLVAGFYDPATGARLPTADGGDSQPFAVVWLQP